MEKVKLINANRPLLARDMEQLVERLLPVQTFCSNRIEGNRLTLKETELVISAIKTSAALHLAADVEILVMR